MSIKFMRLLLSVDFGKEGLFQMSNNQTIAHITSSQLIRILLDSNINALGNFEHARTGFQLRFLYDQQSGMIEYLSAERESPHRVHQPVRCHHVDDIRALHSLLVLLLNNSNILWFYDTNSWFIWSLSLLGNCSSVLIKLLVTITNSSL